MNPLHEAAAEIQASFAERSWSFCFIGGLAVQRWGEPRTTQDVDATLLTGFGNEEIFVDALLSVFRGRLDEALIFRELRPLLELKEDSSTEARLRSLFEDAR